MQSLEENGEIVFGEDNTTQPQRKYLLKSNLNENFPSIVSFGGSDDALLEELGIPFETPKPVDFARSLVALITSRNDVIVDFFAGSGTLGHAVKLQNMVDDGERRYILVQLPEPFDDANTAAESAVDFCDSLNKPRNIAEITKERLRRAAKKIKNENLDYEGDLGFRVFRLATSNIRAWDPAPDDLEESLQAAIDHIKPGRTEQDLLYELLLKLGLDLCVPIETITIGDKTVHSVGGGTLIACLDERITSEDAEPLASGIADWHAGIEGVGETTVVFRDSAFADDIAKTNVAAILHQRGLANVRSL